MLEEIKLELQKCKNKKDLQIFYRKIEDKVVRA